MDPDCRGLCSYGPPSWCHHHSMKMVPEKQTDEEKASKILRISGSAAFLIISFHPEEGEWCWRVDWRIYHGVGSDNGYRLFTKENLESAFTPSPIGSRSQEDRFFSGRYNADAGQQGRYLRQGRWLNIPGPGTGNDGDPNISIEITPEIYKAVKELLS